MENQTPQNQEEMLLEVLENTRKTRQYLKWQLIITIALVVIPLIAMVIVVPIALSALSSAYTSVLQ